MPTLTASSLVPSSFRDLPSVVGTIFAETIVNRLGYLVTPFLVFFLAARGVTGAETSYVLGAGNLLGPAVGGAGRAVPGPRGCGRWRRRRC